MKIKRTVEMTLPQLIEWAWENDIKNKRYSSAGDTTVFFDKDGLFGTGIYKLHPHVKFKVEIEEEITEDTELNLIVVNQWVEEYDVVTAKKSSINDVKHSATKYCYLLNDDGSIGQLIWKDGEMVD